MATNTTNYGWAIPESTDYIVDGATAIATLGQDIDDFISGSSAEGKMFHSYVDRNTTSRTTASASWDNTPTGGAHQLTITLGKSGVAMVWLHAALANSTSTARNDATLGMTGGYSMSASLNDAISKVGSVRQSGSTMWLIDGTPGATVQLTVNFQTTAGTLTAYATTIKALVLG